MPHYEVVNNNELCSSTAVLIEDVQLLVEQNDIIFMSIMPQNIKKGLYGESINSPFYQWKNSEKTNYFI